MRWVERPLNFRYTLKWMPREQLTVVDALAKSPAFRSKVLVLRKEVGNEARDKVNEARAASARGQQSQNAKRDLRKAKRARKRAVEEERKRAHAISKEKENEKQAERAKRADDEEKRIEDATSWETPTDDDRVTEGPEAN